MDPPPQDLPFETIIIVAVVCATVVLILLIILIVLCIRRYQTNAKDYPEVPPSSGTRPVITALDGVADSNSDVAPPPPVRGIPAVMSSVQQQETAPQEKTLSGIENAALNRSDELEMRDTRLLYSADVKPPNTLFKHEEPPPRPPSRMANGYSQKPTSYGLRPPSYTDVEYDNQVNNNRNLQYGNADYVDMNKRRQLLDNQIAEQSKNESDLNGSGVISKPKKVVYEVVV